MSQNIDFPLLATICPTIRCPWPAALSPRRQGLGLQSEHANRHTSSQAYRRTGAQANERTGTQANERTGTQANERTGTQANERTGTQANERTGTQAHFGETVGATPSWFVGALGSVTAY